MQRRVCALPSGLITSNPMANSIILWISDDAFTSGSIAPSLERAGYELHTTSNGLQATLLALLGRRIEAIVLDQRAKERASLGLAWLLRSVRADVPIVLLSSAMLEPLPRCVDACVCLGRELESLLTVLNALVATGWDRSPVAALR